MYETVGQIKSKNNGQVVVGKDKLTTVSRVIRPDELKNLDQGIIPKGINNTTFTPEDHVGDKNKSTSYNSASINIEKSNTQSMRSGNRIVEIDLNKLPDHVEIVDLSIDDKTRNVRLNGNEKAMNYAANSSEVLIKGKINPEAVTLLDDSDIDRIRNTPKQQSTIYRDNLEKEERRNKNNSSAKNNGNKKNNNVCGGKGRSFK